MNLENTNEKVLQNSSVDNEVKKNNDSNSVVIRGKITSKKKFSHSMYGERFYTSFLNVKRLSEYEDNIPITISERLLLTRDIEIGDNVIIKGQFRSYNGYEDGKNKLDLTVFAKDIIFEDDIDEKSKEDEDVNLEVSNEVVLIGHICKKPIYRKTPSGREITDLLLAVNREYSKSDYIPAIAWGTNAIICEKLPVGMKVNVVGRIQSREYEKKFDNGSIEIKTAYELSVSKLKTKN